MLSIAALARKAGLRDIFLHLILDGRSAPPNGAVALLEKYKKRFQEYKIVSAVGRGYALDRGRDYGNKTLKTYNSLVYGEGLQFDL